MTLSLSTAPSRCIGGSSSILGSIPGSEDMKLVLPTLEAVIKQAFSLDPTLDSPSFQ